MPVPPDPVLVAAGRWLEQLEIADIARARTLLNSTTRYGDITPTQYSLALDWLLKSGAIDCDFRPLFPRPYSSSIFKSAVVEALWFTNADVLVAEPLEIPDDAMRAAVALGISNDDAFAHLHSAWGKVDIAYRERIGLAGELELFRHLKADTVASHVAHVAAESDGYGFDIAVQHEGLVANLEVKTTTRLKRTTIYLSRNEYETSKRDPNWYLVTVRLDESDSIVSIATVERDWIQENLPRDVSRLGHWESARLDIPPTAMTGGIPALQTILREPAGRGVLWQPAIWAD